MSLTFKVEKLVQKNEIVLHEGKKEIRGYDAIHSHLDELKKELHHWYYCNC
jgi:hypothetical protein